MMAGEEATAKNKGKSGSKAKPKDERSKLRAELRRSEAKARRALRQAASDQRAANNRVRRKIEVLTPWELAQWRRHERRRPIHEAFAKFTRKTPWGTSPERAAAKSRTIT